MPGTLAQIHDDVWTHDAELSFFGLQVGTRMTVVRLPDRSLWVHSPIPIDEALFETIRSLGPTRHIIAPNAWHHLHVGPLAQRCADARVYAAAKLRTKRADLTIDEDLTNTPPSSWGGVLTPVVVEGTWLHETAFIHHPSRLLITSDLFQNVTQCAHTLTRLWFRFGGVYQRPGIERPIRLLFHNRAKARVGIDRLLAHEFEGVVLAHGDIIHSDGRERLAEGYAWLKG